MIHFISAIDTDAGKTMATGYFARELMQKGRRVITMKLAQTGCTGMSDDIVTHRRIMGIDLLPEDKTGVTCPYLFPFPASPHLSASMEGTAIELSRLEHCILQLQPLCDDLVIEGVGGLMVPLTPDVLLIDWFARHRWPMILVTSARLGSINHTLLSLEAIKHRKIALEGIIFNQHPAAPAEIANDTRQVIRRVVERDFKGAFWLEMPVMLTTQRHENTEE